MFINIYNWFLDFIREIGIFFEWLFTPLNIDVIVSGNTYTLPAPAYMLVGTLLIIGLIRRLL
jgi:hypothetical protein